jgi:hypothetical protein
MFAPYFTLAARAPGRQQTFRRTVVLHLLTLLAAAWALSRHKGGTPPTLLGHMLLVAGIIEGAALVGWRLTQLPKSQALEFLLVSPLRPGRLFLAEAAVGLAYLALVTLAGLPVLTLLAGLGAIDPLDPLPLTVMPFTWGAVTGLGLTVRAYEPAERRRWGERLTMALVLLYLIVGVLAAENLRRWLKALPPDLGAALFHGFIAFHLNNPFGVLQFWLQNDLSAAWERAAALQLGATAAAGLFLWRGAARLQGHFHELHYQPRVDRARRARRGVGDEPLTWWAVKRVSKYSGRINLWLAGGFCALYAVYLLTGAWWPAWLGKRIFEMCGGAGGAAGLAAGLVVLAAVPAAFQYGLWDSSTQDRCRRLELLLLTRLGGRDYWDAAAAAAWKRGRGYFLTALLLWGAAALEGRLGPLEALAAVAAGVLLWALYFALGFRAFARGTEAGGLGLALTVGLPLAAWGLARAGWPTAAALLPPGAVYAAGAAPASPALVLGLVFVGTLTLLLARRALVRCDAELRAWYDRNHGHKVMS